MRRGLVLDVRDALTGRTRRDLAAQAFLAFHSRQNRVPFGASRRASVRALPSVRANMTRERERLNEHFQEQISICHAFGSPFTAALLERMAEDLDAGGPTADLVAEVVRR
jgi:hypothetical protein